MRAILSFTFLLLLSTQLSSQTIFMDSLVIKKEMKTAPLLVGKSMEKLSKYLTENDSSDTQKVLNIFTWITNNIKYDLKAFQKIKNKKYSSENRTLRKRKGICYQYSDLFNRMCQHAGILSLRIDGYSRGQYYNEDDTFYEADHAWNAVKLEGKWYLLDLTFGSGYLAQRDQKLKRWWAKIFKKEYVYNTYRYKKSPDFQYFLSPPEKMILQHLPADPVFQLLEFPVSIASFEAKGWKTYRPKKDTAFSQTYKIEALYEELDKYSRMSPLQYAYKTAFNAYTYNPKNTKMLAYAEYSAAPGLKVVSEKINEQIQGNKAAIKAYKGSIAYGKKHSVVIKKETAKIRKVVLRRIKEELINPSVKKAKKVKRYISRYSRNLKKWNVDSDRFEKRSLSYAMAKARQVPSLGNQPKAKYNKPATVKKNKALIAKLSVKIDSLLIVSDTLISGYKKTVALQQPISAKLVKLNNESKDKIEFSTKKFINDRRLKELSDSWFSISETGTLIDSLEGELFEINEVLKKTYRAVSETNSRIRSDISLSQKLIVQNCRLAGMDQCDGQKFSLYNKLRRNTYVNNSKLLGIYQQLINRNLENFEDSYDLLIEQSKLLIENKKYINYFKLGSLGNIAFKRNKGLFELTHLRKKSNQEVKKLQRENGELYKRKRRG